MDAGAPSAASPIGHRIHVLGNTGSGKSTLGARLAAALDVPFVELDALNWLPGWRGLNLEDPAELERRIAAATAGEGWVVAGSYLDLCQRVFWPRLETAVFLDLALPRLLARLVARSWLRHRSRELLWGTNVERFWPQLRVWRPEESLLGWAATQQGPKRRRLREDAADPRFAHVRFVRLASPGAIEAFARRVEARS